MIFGLLSVGAVIYGLGVVMKGAFSLPVVISVTQKVSDTYVQSVKDIYTSMYKRGETIADEAYALSFGEIPLLQEAVPYCPDLEFWMNKRVTFTKSEMQDFRELLLAYQNFSETIAPVLELPVIIRQRIILLQPIASFLYNFHEDRIYEV